LTIISEGGYFAILYFIDNNKLKELSLTGTSQINLSDLSSGVYNLKIVSKYGSAVKRVLIK